MQEGVYNKILDLIEKTGDKFVITEKGGERSYVMMTVEDYEKLLSSPHNDLGNLTEDQLLEKINQEIALWKSNNQKNSKENLIKNIFSNK